MENNLDFNFEQPTININVGNRNKRMALEFERSDIELIFDNIDAEILDAAIGYEGTSEEELLDILERGVEIEKLQSICSHRNATDRVIATAIENYPIDSTILNRLLNIENAHKESYLAAAKSSSINSEIFDKIENSDILDGDIMLAAFGNSNISAYSLYSMLLIKCSFDPEMSAEFARNPSIDEPHILSLLISFAAEHKSGLKELERNGTVKFLNAVIGNPNVTDKCFAAIASFYPEFLNDVSIGIFNSPNCGVKGMMTLAWNENTNKNVLAAIPKEIIEMKNSFCNSKIFEAASGLSEYGDMNFVAKHKYDKIKKFVEGKRIELVR